MPFTAILYLNARPSQVAFLTTADILAGICFALFAGVWADRLKRRPIMIAADIGRAAIIGSIPVAAWFGALRIEQLYAVAFLAGILTTFFDVSYQSYLPTLIDRQQLIDGNSKLAASESVAEFGSFSVAGWLVQLVTAPGAMAVDALSFLFSAASLLTIRAPETVPAAVDARRSVLTEIVEGMPRRIQVARDRRQPCGLFAGAGMFGAVIVLFVTRDLDFRLVQGPLHHGPDVAGRRGVGRLVPAAGWRRGDDRRPSCGDRHAVCCRGVHTAAIAATLPIAQQLISDPGDDSQHNQTTMRQAIAPHSLLGRVTAAEHFWLSAGHARRVDRRGHRRRRGWRASRWRRACCMFSGALIFAPAFDHDVI